MVFTQISGLRDLSNSSQFRQITDAVYAAYLEGDVQIEESTEAFEIETPPPSAAELNAEQLKEYLEHLRPEDFGKFNL